MDHAQDGPTTDGSSTNGHAKPATALQTLDSAEQPGSGNAQSAPGAATGGGLAEAPSTDSRVSDAAHTTPAGAHVSTLVANSLVARTALVRSCRPSYRRATSMTTPLPACSLPRPSMSS